MDPLGLTTKEYPSLPFLIVYNRNVPELSPHFFGIDTSDDKQYNLSGICHVPVSGSSSLESRSNAKMKTIFAQLQKTYSGRIGFEFEHIPVCFYLFNMSRIQVRGDGWRNILNRSIERLYHMMRRSKFLNY